MLIPFTFRSNPFPVTYSLSVVWWAVVCPKMFKLVNWCWKQVFLVKYTKRIKGNQKKSKNLIYSSRLKPFKVLVHNALYTVVIQYRELRPLTKKVYSSDVMTVKLPFLRWKILRLFRFWNLERTFTANSLYIRPWT